MIVSCTTVELAVTQMLWVGSLLEVLTGAGAGGGGEWRVCAGGLQGYNCQCCFKKS